MKRRAILFFGMLAVAVAVTSASSFLSHRVRPSLHETNGNIREVNVDERVASLEVIDPDTGQSSIFEGFVAKDCKILIDGKEASLADVRVSDHAEVTARASDGIRRPDGKRTLHFVAESIRIDRSGA